MRPMGWPHSLWAAAFCPLCIAPGPERPWLSPGAPDWGIWVFPAPLPDRYVRQVVPARRAPAEHLQPTLTGCGEELSSRAQAVPRTPADKRVCLNGCLGKDTLRLVLGPGAQVKTSMWHQCCHQNNDVCVCACMCIYERTCICIVCVCVCVHALDPFTELRGRVLVQVRVRVRVTGVAVRTLQTSNPRGRPTSSEKRLK